ncbi:MAG: ATP F0F1 synthase subunit B [Pseudomonadota bacterium]
MITTLTYAVEGVPFASMRNSDWVVLLGFLVFVGLLAYLKVPAMLTGMLDKRAERIRAELDEARALREEAQTLLATYERQQKDVEAQSSAIVSAAKKEAEAAALQAKKDLEDAIARRLQAAADQIASAEASAVRDVRDTAASVAIAAATKVLSERLDGDAGGALIDQSIDTVAARLN